MRIQMHAHAIYLRLENNVEITEFSVGKLLNSLL